MDFVEQILYKIKNGEISSKDGIEILKQCKVNNTPYVVDDNDVAIIGISGRYPGANDLEEFWDNLQLKKTGIIEVPKERWDIDKYYSAHDRIGKKTYCRWGGFISDAELFDPMFFNILPSEAEIMDPQQRVFLEEAWNALEDAGYNTTRMSGMRCGVFAGATQGDYGTNPQILNNSYDPHYLLGTNMAFLAARIAYLMNLNGPCMTIDTACSSSLVAIHLACKSIIDGDSDMALAGGVCVLATPHIHICTGKSEMLSKTGECHSFDEKADGFIPSEGAGVIVLKSLKKAIEDNDRIYGVIKGSAVNQDGKTNGITAPSAKSQMQLETEVYQRYHIDPNNIDYIETHGTGTSLGDPIEICALKKAYGQYTDRKGYCAISTVKSNIGHALTASGVISVIKVLMCLKNKKMIPIANFEKANDKIDFKNSPFYVLTETKDWEKSEGLRMAAISSFGLSGTNCHMVIQEPPKQRGSDIKKPGYLILFSAKSLNALQKKMMDMLLWCKKEGKSSNIQDIAHTMQFGRSHFQYRSYLVVKNLEELVKQLEFHMERNWKNIVTENENLEQYSLEYISDSLRNEENEEKYLNILNNLGEKYVAGEVLDEAEWKGLNFGKTISLPTYPFEKERYWVKFEDKEDIESGQVRDDIVEDVIQNVNETDDLHQLAIDYTKNIIAKQFKIPMNKIDITTGFEEYGIDSISIKQLNATIAKDLNEESSTLFFTYKNVSELAEYLEKKHEDQLKELYSEKKVVLKKESPENKVSKSDISISCQQEDIAIIGISGKFPMANNVEEFWDNLKLGKDCIIEIPKERWDYEKYYDPKTKEGMYCKWGGFIENVDHFDPIFFGISPLEAKYMDPHERKFMESAWSCIEDAGYTVKNFAESCQGDDGASVGVFVGASFNNYQLWAGKEFAQGNSVVVNSQNFSVANRISYIMNFNGPSQTVDTACSSSLYAVHLACESIRRGECKGAVVGGVNLSIHPSKYMTLCSGKFGASNGRCMSFAEGGDGYVPAETTAAILIKPLWKAKEDKDHIYAIIKGTAVNHGGKTYGYSVPNPVAQTKVIENAIKKSGVSAESISYIEAHGTGTSLGDPIEITGLTEAFEKYTDKKHICAIGSVKSNIGHGEAAAGISQLLKVVLQMEHKMLVPSLLHSEEINHNIDFENTPFYLQQTLKEWKKEQNVPRRAGISSFGVGGVNVHVVLEEYEGDEKLEKELLRPYVFVLSAKKEKELCKYVQEFKVFVEKNPQINLSDLAYTLHIGREEMKCRIAFIANSLEEVVDKLGEILQDDIEKSHYFAKVEDNKSVELVTEMPENIQTLCDYWLVGKKIDWINILYKQGVGGRISLPTYPFEGERYWLVNSVNDSYFNYEYKDSQEILEENSEEEIDVHEEETSIVERLKQSIGMERELLISEFLQDEVARLLEFTEGNKPEKNQGFFELGMDSVTSSKLFTIIEEAFHIEMYQTALFDYSNINELTAYIIKKFQQNHWAQEENPTQEKEKVQGKKPTQKEKVIEKKDQQEYEKIYYSPYWKKTENTVDTIRDGNTLLICKADPNKQIYKEFCKKWTEGNVYLCEIGKTYSRIRNGFYLENIEDEKQVEGLLQRIEKMVNINNYIFAGLDDSCYGGIEAVFTFTKVLLKKKVTERTRIMFVYDGGENGIRPLQEGIGAFARVVEAENPQLLIKTVSVTTDSFTEDVCEGMINAICNEGWSDGNATEVLYKDGQRFVKKVREVKYNFKDESNEQTVSLKEGGVYLITGGAGQLGLLFAKEILRHVNAKVVLCGRKCLNPETIKVISQLQDKNKEIMYVRADLGNAKAVKRLINRIYERYGHIDGIIHGAGVLKDSFIINKSLEEFKLVLQPKVLGTINLDHELANRHLDFFVLMSSFAAVMGNAGQSDYSYANGFLNAFATERNIRCKEGKCKGRTIVFNWSLWRQGGMMSNKDINIMGLETIGMKPLEIPEGLSDFMNILDNGFLQYGAITAIRSKVKRVFSFEDGNEVASDLQLVPWCDIPFKSNQIICEVGDYSDFPGYKEIPERGEVEFSDDMPEMFRNVLKSDVDFTSMMDEFARNGQGMNMLLSMSGLMGDIQNGQRDISNMMSKAMESITQTLVDEEEEICPSIESNKQGEERINDEDVVDELMRILDRLHY